MVEGNGSAEKHIGKPASQPEIQETVAAAAVEHQDRGSSQTAIKEDTNSLVKKGALNDLAITGGNSATGKPAENGVAPKNEVMSQFGNLSLDGPGELKDTTPNAADPSQEITYKLNDGMNGQKPIPEVQTIQQELNALNFSVGVADGRLGPATQKGIKDFQTANGLPVTGEADPTTQAKLKELAGQKVEQVKAEAKLLEPMIQEFMSANDPNKQRTALAGYQKELANFFAANGESATGQVLNQVASDLKSDKGISVRSSKNSLDITNNRVISGLQEATPTELWTNLSAKGISSVVDDGDSDYEDAYHTKLSFNSTISDGKVTTKDKSFIAHKVSDDDSGGYDDGGDGGGGDGGNSGGLHAGQIVILQNPDGSIGTGIVVSP